MDIQTLSVEQCTEFFMSDPKLCLAGLSDETLQVLASGQQFPLNPEEEALGLFENGQLIAVAVLGLFTKQVLNLHMYVGTYSQKRNKISKIYETMEEYIQDNYSQRKVILCVPSACRHVIAMAKRLKFSNAGKITNGITWREQVCDLLLFSVDVKEATYAMDR